MADPTRQLLRWLAAHDVPGRVLLLCADAPLPPVARDTLVVRLPGCLKDTGIGLPAQLLASGVGAVEVTACPSAPEEAAAQVTGWTQVLGDRVRRHTAPPLLRRGRPTVLTLGQVPLPRRVVLGLGGLDAAPLDLDLDDAARTIAALRLLGAAPRPDAATRADSEDVAPSERDVLAAAGPPSAAAALAVDGCVACGVCVRACPHDALVLDHDGDTSTLTHLREDCRAELECLRLCPVDAFSTSGSLPLADVLAVPTAVLAEVRTATCERCGARHPADEGPLCATCRFREGNAFGSSMPPGLAERLARRRDEST
ncbi:4Fe-4S dicluster domain-containing protein [Georgenia sp. 311]|uniref:4Fe-4S dicluster domain-containing protein n=1 Tax=Georgenia sp. 311 TaxID=2585134 RepID=UPI001112B0F6|nr:4Fe-4S dicluster domain-containing protein [Georgenia sp. 311]TNC17331.1 4Fe-4S dicluster domain-containing protein [Georgenia sp. 311]